MSSSEHTSEYEHSKNAHGRIKHKDGFFYYTQGGLDNYCSVYSIINATNYLKFCENKNEFDFISRNDWKFFKQINNIVSNYNYFLNAKGARMDFGAEGMYPNDLLALIKAAPDLKQAREMLPRDYDSSRKCSVELDQKTVVGLLSKFTCLVWMEEENDSDDGHWLVTLPGKSGGGVLDSIRGITRWEFKKKEFRIIRGKKARPENPGFKPGITWPKRLHAVIPVTLRD